MPADGGYFARDWAPAGMVVSGLWAVAVIGGGRLLPPGIPVRAALGALLALTLLAFLSTAWADAPAVAFATASQFLTVVLGAWTLALAPWRAGAAHLLVAGLAAGAAFAMGDSLLDATADTDLTGQFIDGRWAEPIGYPNGLGNFGFFFALAALAVSAAPGRGVPARTVTLALATFLAGCSLLPQSRGSILALVAGAVVLVAFSPRRWGVVARLAIAGGALAAFAGPIFDLYDVARDGVGVGAAVDDAARAVMKATAVAAAAGLLLALFESRVRVGEGAERASRVLGIAAVAVVAISAVGAAAMNAGRIDRFVERQRDAWERPGVAFEEDRRGRTRLLSDDPLQRYQYWHVALDAFEAKPLAGVGAGGFEARYIRDRVEAKYSSFPHSLFMRALAEGGLLGLLGMLAFLGAAVAGVVLGWRRASGGDRAMTAAAMAAGVCFLLHAQLDWLEEFPALAGPAVAFLMVAAVLRRREAEGDEPPARLGLPATAAAVLVTVVALAVLVPPYASIRYRERANAIWRTDAEKAYRDLDRAAALDPLADLPALTEGTIALQRRELERAREAFEAAIERDDEWLARFELGLTLAALGDREAGTRQLELARALNPQEPAIPAAQEEIESGKAIDPVRLNRRLFESPLFKPRRLT